MSSTTQHALARDGTGLLLRHWAAPAAGAPWATVLIVHGLAEHSGRYEHVGEHFADAGIETWAIDLRGSGHPVARGPGSSAGRSSTMTSRSG